MWKRERFVTKLTTKNEIQELLDSLRPVACKKDLIRLGPMGDGGYLVPDDLKGVTAIFSLGVGSQSGFEMACVERGMRAFLADKSVDGPQVAHKLFHFTHKYIGATTNSDYITIDDWVNVNLKGRDEELMLQIDIEGEEYEVLLSASNALLARCKIIVVEFHNLDQLWNRAFFNIIKRVFNKLLQTHSCVHSHPNNHCGLTKKNGIDIPHVVEMTFVRHEHVNRNCIVHMFPHTLDCSNNSKKPPMHLPTCWHKDD